MCDLGIRRQLKWKTDQRVANGDVQIEKCKTDENITDLLTKHQSADAIAKHCKLIFTVIGGERNPEMPRLAGNENIPIQAVYYCR